VKLTTHLHLRPRSRMRGAIHPLPRYAFMAWCLVKSTGTTLPFYLYWLQSCFIHDKFEQFYGQESETWFRQLLIRLGRTTGGHLLHVTQRMDLRILASIPLIDTFAQKKKIMLLLIQEETNSRPQIAIEPILADWQPTHEAICKIFLSPAVVITNF